MDSDRRYLTVREVARRLGLARTRAYELIAMGHIPAVRIGERSLRVPVAWLEQVEAEAMSRLRRDGDAR